MYIGIGKRGQESKANIIESAGGRVENKRPLKRAKKRTRRVQVTLNPLRRCWRTVNRQARSTVSQESYAELTTSTTTSTHPSSEGSDGTTGIHKSVGFLNTLHL